MSKEPVAPGDDKPEYGVAISFLSVDCATAVAIAKQLSPLTVFCYPRSQEELAGGDGMEKFRSAFRHQSRVQVVLYRKGWGETPWTRIEQTAITDRCLAEGWDGLVFVALDNAARPRWVPDTKIHFDLTNYPLNQLVGAIKLRAQELGAELRPETPRERARRAQAIVDFENETRALFKGQKGVDCAREQAVALCDLLQAEIEGVAQEENIEINFARGTQHGIAWTTPTAGLTSGFSSAINVIDDDSYFQASLYKHRILLPGQGGHYYEPDMPLVHRQNRFEVHRSPDLGFCWRDGSGDLLSSASLANRILNDFWSVYEESVVDPIDWRRKFLSRR
jgi:hypothetical protein